jgi:hypothetical protein
MSLNKHIATLLSALILFSGIGLAVNVHYCRDEISSVALTYKVQEACDSAALPVNKKACCGNKRESHKKCCKDDVIKLNKHTDNLIVKSLQLDLAAFCPSAVQSFEAGMLYEAVANRQVPAAYASPHAPPLYKLYCRLIFYA